jgi:hypothetical protein
MRSVMLSVIISDVVLQYRYMRVPQNPLLSNRVILPIVQTQPMLQYVLYIANNSGT